LDADAIGISGPESTNPRTLSHPKNPHFEPPTGAHADAGRPAKPGGWREISGSLKTVLMRANFTRSAREHLLWAMAFAIP
jgi:hypothetical protein